VKQVFHRHCRSPWVRTDSFINNLSLIHKNLMGLTVSMTACQRNLGYRANAGQGLSPKTLCFEGINIVESCDFARRVSGNGHRELIVGNPTAIIAHLNEFLAPIPDGDVYLRGTRIEGIFHQFLDDRGRSFHHLTGGDLVDEVIGELVNERNHNDQTIKP